MSLKDTTETYLNLDSDQFNSWIKDFDNKYEEVEKSNFNKNDNNAESNINNLILSESDQSVEIESDSSNESDSDSEINSNSNIFMKNNIKTETANENTESSFINNTSSANKILMFSKLKTSIRKKNLINDSPTNRNSTNHSSTNHSSTNRNSTNSNSTNQRIIHIKEEPGNVRNKQLADHEFIPVNYTSNIFSLSQLNSMIPESFTESKNRINEKNINDEYINQNTNGAIVNNNKYNTKLGEVALYKFISRRRK